jgi:hypothetical protein
MRGVYTRPHRNCIYEPATIHDIPFEVLKDSFVFLVKQRGSDLASPSLTSRAFRAVALELMNSRMRFVNEGGRIAGLTCGLHLRSLVGLEMCTIKRLDVDLEFIGKELIPLIARLVSHTLSSLCLCSDAFDMSSECYDALGIFFEQCDGIRNLRLELFDFGDNPVAIPQNVKDGFNRVNQLNLIMCQRNIRILSRTLQPLSCVCYIIGLSRERMKLRR